MDDETPTTVTQPTPSYLSTRALTLYALALLAAITAWVTGETAFFADVLGEVVDAAAGAD